MNEIEDAVYGPVPSWRFGRSLGIDPTLPPKKCTLGCVYCQIGPTRNYVEYENKNISVLESENLEIILDKYLQEMDVHEIDIIIFSGSGEPTLNSHLSSLIDIVRDKIHNKPVGILSNGTLIGNKKVKNALLKLDMVTLKLDTSNQDLYRLINHPSKNTPPVGLMINNYTHFRKEYGGFMGLEVMALEYQNRCNISGSYSDHLIDNIVKISPDVVQIEVPYRPTSKGLVLTPPKDKIQDFTDRLKRKLGVDNVWVYGEHDAMKDSKIWRIDNIEERIIATLKHRPCTMQDLCLVFARDLIEIKDILSELIKNNKIETRMHQNKLFYELQSS
jgi:wyosine [tRNA(Phe)-imidazoG37] synthetase (radical SAM superfamily)